MASANRALYTYIYTSGRGISKQMQLNQQFKNGPQISSSHFRTLMDNTADGDRKSLERILIATRVRGRDMRAAQLNARKRQRAPQSLKEIRITEGAESRQE